MKVHNARHWQLGLVVLISLLGGGIRAAFRSQETRQTVPQTTLSHIIDETEPFCRILVPDCDVMHFTVYSTPAFYRSGAARNMWTVECLDEKNKEIAHIFWDEDAKRCLSLSRIPSGHLPDSLPAFHREAALDVAREWAGRLQAADFGNIKSAQAEMQNTGASWQVRLRMQDRYVTVWVDARSGELMRIMTRELPDTRRMQASEISQSDSIPRI